jgi:hypothetical protein
MCVTCHFLLQENFGCLRHLIALDLSGNKLQHLPDSFGQLVLLQRLDLYSNQLVSLPLSFGNLKKLKWLDLKNNPLEDGLREAAGTCVSSKECNQCATKVRTDLSLCGYAMWWVLGAGVYESSTVPARAEQASQVGPTAILGE